MLSQVRLGLFALLLGSAAGQSAPPTATVYALDIDPGRQELALAFESDVGFPLGKLTASAGLKCAEDGKPSFSALRETGLDQYDARPEGTRALLSQGVVKLDASGLTVRGRDGDLRFACQGKVLYTDFGRIAASPKAQAKVYGTDATFGVTQDVPGRQITIQYPLTATRTENGLICPKGLKLELTGAGGLARGPFRLGDVRIVDVAREGRAAVFLQGEQALLPLRSGGNDAGTAKVRGAAVGPVLVLWYAPDFGRADGWHKLTVDLAKHLMWTQDGAKPNLPFGR